MNSIIEAEAKTEKIKLSLMASFKLIIVEQFLSTTAHALPNIFRTGNIILKIIWLLCFLACAAYCISKVKKTINIAVKILNSYIIL